MLVSSNVRLPVGFVPKLRCLVSGLGSWDMPMVCGGCTFRGSGQAACCAALEGKHPAY